MYKKSSYACLNYLKRVIAITSIDVFIMFTDIWEAEISSELHALFF